MALATAEKKESKRVRNMTFLKMQNVQLQLTLIFFYFTDYVQVQTSL